MLSRLAEHWWLTGQVISYYQPSHDMLKNTESEKNTQLAIAWYTRCLNNHVDCKLEDTQSTHYPSRLLDLQGLDRDSTVRVVNTHGFESNCDYFALSHCWGGKVPIMLQADNIEVLKRGILLQELPLTFRQAMTVTRTLGVRYLWIDSLCIIQDSFSDWEFELSRMRDVYKYARLTIAATGSKNSAGGLYFDRDVDLVQAALVPISWNGVPREIYILYDASLWETNIIEAPLNQRAWVVQERILSPRTLHFGNKQISWTCQELEACETFPGGLPQKHGTYNDFYIQRDLAQDAAASVRSLWPRIATVYSSCGLTNEMDKAIAIAGIAEEIQGRTGDVYYAGMWKSALVPQLCWTVDHCRNEMSGNGVTPKRSDIYRAPSWSWLSIDSNIEFYTNDHGSTENFEIMIEVSRVDIQASTRNVFGSIRNGRLDCHGILIPARWINRSTDSRAREMILLFGSNAIQHGDFWNDKPSQVVMDIGQDRQQLGDVFCLPLLSNTTTDSQYTGGSYIGLILAATNQRRDEYERVGCFQLEFEQGKSLFHINDAVGRRSTLPPCEFTIV